MYQDFQPHSGLPMYKTIVVTDQAEMPSLDLEVISFDQYVTDYPKLGELRTRIINLCNTDQYLSRGYYCSLLAESRQHQVLPSVNTINDLRHLNDTNESSQLAPLLLPKISLGLEHPMELLIYFGWTSVVQCSQVARSLFERFPSPILKALLTRDEGGVSAKVVRMSPADLDEAESLLFYERLRLFTAQVWRSPTRRQYRWDMAILHDPAEVNSPSDTEAIKRFIKAAAKVGIHAETVLSRELKQISKYDALFIRETTSIDHPTYRLARRCQIEGLVVIDDATSILRCCNKIFLHDAFSYNGVSAPRTIIVAGSTEAELDRIEAKFEYPMVLKMPESSFSIGVYKVASRSELKEKLAFMLAESALALVQEYLFTDFDWRVGVLNGRAIYACKYYMARDHWQIYNHACGKKRGQVGGFETVPTFEVPRAVLKAALKACSIIGTGLYGVDIKQRNNQIYVIEVNDNPSIDHRVEDQYLGDELYMIIMQEFADRLEQRGRS
ncbi:MAG: glutathione synthase/RimK-type ligase-like ATP-grasp enzyme [Lentimonas sp.]|jgi:glutathione synthase/RimK-type ligase-like ATP-grasp enzyme